MTRAAVKRIVHEVDATGQSVGRLATKIAILLRGKHRADFTPHIDAGDAVLLKHASLVKFTGRKLAQKELRHHTMYPGGLKRTPMKKAFVANPGTVIRHAVYGMLPKNNRRDEIIKRLKIEA